MYFEVDSRERERERERERAERVRERDRERKREKVPVMIYMGKRKLHGRVTFVSFGGYGYKCPKIAVTTKAYAKNP